MDAWLENLDALVMQRCIGDAMTIYSTVPMPRLSDVLKNSMPH
jgi:hypothetical protein